MTDIVERLRTEGAMRGLYDVPALQREAADEIERLRGIAEGRAKNAADEIEHLRAEIRHLREGQPQAQSRGGL